MPRSFNVSSSTATSVTLTWMSPDPFNGPMSTVYQLLYNRENSTSSPNSRQIFGLRTTISGLQADVTYVFSVRGSTFDGDGVLIWGEYSTIRVLNGKLNVLDYIVLCVGGSKRCHVSYCPYSTNQLHNYCKSYCTVMQLIGQIQYSYVLNWANTAHLGKLIQYSYSENLFKEYYVNNTL